MPMQLSRRQFLKYCAVGAATVPLMQMAALPVQAKAPRAPLGEQLINAVTAEPFNSLPSNLTLGAPLADIAMGWDGTVWGIDRNGVPHYFDQVTQQWDIYSSQLSAVTYVSKWQGLQATPAPKFPYPLTVRGTEVAPPTGAPIQAIGEIWNNLPASFQLGLDGAAEAAGVLHLFRHGRYVTIDDATGNASAPVAINTFGNWPTTANWTHGAFDAIGSNAEQPDNPQVVIWSNGEYVIVDMVARQVVDGPHDLAWFVAGPMQTIMQQGFQAITYHTTSYDLQAFQGAVRWESTEANGGASPTYTNLYPDNIAWMPVLASAPTGRIGALYGVVIEEPALPVPGGTIVMHDGSGWQGSMTTPYFFTHVAAGADGSVFALNTPADASGQYQLRQLQPDGSWQLIAGFTMLPAQLSVADATLIWLRDQDGNVYQLNSGSFVQVTTISGATHIAASPDGTVWHAKGDPNAHRLLSESNAPATVLSNAAGGNAVNKVASTGFGTAFVLADNAGLQAADGTATTQVYSYDSLYAFKTSKTYVPVSGYAPGGQSIIPAGNMVFLLAMDNDWQNDQDLTFVAAVDAQSGLEIWPNRFYVPDSDSGGLAVNGIVYDTALNLVYTSFAQDVYALNAATGALAWHYQLDGDFGLVGPLGLCNSKLCFGANSGGNGNSFFLFQIDPAAALQSGAPVAVPSAALPNGPLGVTAGAPVGDDNGTVYLVYALPDGDGTGTYQVSAVRSADGSLAWSQSLPAANDTFSPADCLVARFAVPNTMSNQPALFVNGGTGIHALRLTDGSSLGSYAIPTPTSVQHFSSQMAWRNDTLYVGDNQGKLYVINALNLALVTSTNDSQAADWIGVLSQPVIIATDDPNDTVGVYFTRGDQNLWVFDPAAGNLEQIATDQTGSTNIAFDPVHGLLYAMGWNTLSSAQLGQFFALRPYQAIQDERSFIIESQLLQDFASDAEAGGNGVARFQTHVTIVDDNNAPRANSSVKVWAEEDDTVVIIDGMSYTIGTTVPAYFTTDGTGSFTIVSDATDLTTNSLLLWAAFMDEHERITITPDSEFHARLPQTAASGSTDPSRTDPKQIDLSNATSYDGAPLFSTSSSDQANASQAAQAIAQTTTAAGLGASPATSRMVRTAGGTFAVNAAAATAKYAAYATLPGMAYTPVNAPANQGLTVRTPTGLALTAGGYTALTPADASAQIDAMTGDEVTLVTATLMAGASINSFLSKLKSAWKEIKQTAAKVGQVVVSVAKDIAIGIQYVVNGVTKVVKAVAEDVKDLMVSIGSFLVQLGKDLLKAIEALSLLLHLGEVIKTASIISAQINQGFTDLGSILTFGKATVDGWFQTAEQTITNDFCKLFSALGLSQPAECAPGAAAISSTPLNGYSGMGATATTVYNNGVPNGSSQSVQCGWSSHTMRTNMGNASSPSSVSAASDPFSDAISQFIASLTSDPQLSAAYSAVGSSFSNTFKVNSVEQFFAMALEDLLEVVKAVAISGVAIGQALIDTVMGTAQTVVNGLQQMGNINIPILSTLWKKLTGGDLTFLDLLSFVLAFPVTLIYRAVEGSYPSQGVSASAIAATVAAKVTGLVGSLSLLLLGITTTVIDSIQVFSGGMLAASIAWKLAALVGFMGLAGCNIYKALPGQPEAILVAYLSTASMLVWMIGLAAPPVAPLINTLISAMSVYAYVEQYQATNEPPLTLSRLIVAAVPGIVNLIKFANFPVGLIAPAADAGCRTAAAGIQMAQTIEAWNTVSEELPPAQWSYKQYFPFLPKSQ